MAKVQHHTEAEWQGAAAIASMRSYEQALKDSIAPSHKHKPESAADTRPVHFTAHDSIDSAGLETRSRGAAVKSHWPHRSDVAADASGALAAARAGKSSLALPVSNYIDNIGSKGVHEPVAPAAAVLSSRRARTASRALLSADTDDVMRVPSPKASKGASKLRVSLALCAEDPTSHGTDDGSTSVPSGT
jgi:hypothetical protein